jgi:hypothetical protein
MATRYALDGRGGGEALPPFLQGRTRATAGSFQTQPMITPRPSVVPGEVDPRKQFHQQRKEQFGPGSGVLSGRPSVSKPAITPKQPFGSMFGGNVPGLNQGAATPGEKPPTQTLFEFLKRDLENERTRALSGARSSAAARGVFYGTPLTTSEGDIETSFLRGLGQLQSGLIGQEQQNELARLGLATNLIGQPASFGELSQLGQGDADVYNTIGGLFAGQQPPADQPSITPNVAVNPQQQQPLTQAGPGLPFKRGTQGSLPISPRFLRSR